MKDIVIALKSTLQQYVTFFKWIIISIVTGVLVGIAGVLFHYGIEHSIELREKFHWILLFLPVAGMIITYIYSIAKQEHDRGTNLIFLAIRQDEKITIKTAPLIFIGTILTHLCGGSAGREGAALQLGGSISSILAKPFKLDEKDKKILIMCGMSAGFASLFGTPVTATVFSMEVLSVGIMYYSALLPCTISALVGSSILKLSGTSAPSYTLSHVPSVNLTSVSQTILLGIMCAVLGIIFCIAIKLSDKYFKKFIKNCYLRIFTGGVIVILLTAAVGSFDYNSAGMNIIELAVSGEARPEAFILKILFTAITLGVGYKGGEIVPVFFTGSTFGNVFGKLIGLSGSFGAGIGLTALFCAVTNCPLTSVMLAIELFGIGSLPLFLIAIAVSYMLSGYFGLYSSQKIIYSKTRSEYIDMNSI